MTEVKTRKPKWVTTLYFTTEQGTWEYDKKTKQLKGSHPPVEWCRQNDIKHRLEVHLSMRDVYNLGREIAHNQSTSYRLKFNKEADAVMCKLMFSDLQWAPYEFDEDDGYVDCHDPRP